MSRKQKLLFSFFGPTFLHDHVASRLVKTLNLKHFIGVLGAIQKVLS